MNEMALLKIFYGKPNHFMYRQHIARHWFHLMCECFLKHVFVPCRVISAYIAQNCGRSDNKMKRTWLSVVFVGGLSSVFIGFSIVCIAEVGYFIVRTIYLTLKNRPRNEALMSRAKNFRFIK